MNFIDAIKEMHEKDVIGFHVDCGAFTPIRFNPEKYRVELWDKVKNEWIPFIVGECDYSCADWVVGKIKREDAEVLEYKNEREEEVVA